ncbi:MAG: hypothetical protein Q8N47_09135 [Bryobacterales bacterium]|nr:hypothetical protein [Bryobacterales bacterium]
MRNKTGTQVASPDVNQFFLNHVNGLSGAEVEAARPDSDVDLLVTWSWSSKACWAGK